MIDQVKNIFVGNFNYNLPEEKIAKFPLKNRAQSKLLFYKNGHIKDYHFYELSNLLPKNTLLISNETKVLSARLLFKTTTEANIEVFCLEPFFPKELNTSLQNTNRVEWCCMIGNSKKWKENEILNLVFETFTLQAKKIRQEKNTWIISFEWNNSSVSFAEILNNIGHVPLPPYLKREDNENDKESYQTVFAKYDGSVAAPTAGLHFTNEIIATLKEKEIETTQITLHVGAGTFLPVKSETLEGHHMHEEYIEVSIESLKKIKNNIGPRIAIGTTSLRTLESIYWIAILINKNIIKSVENIELLQWTPYEHEGILSVDEAIDCVIHFLKINNTNFIKAKTQLLIAPPYEVKMVDGIITNFHQPNSTLLLLISAIVGENWKKIYTHALENEYRFLSFGDSSLLMK